METPPLPRTSVPARARADLHLHTSFSGWRHLGLIGARDCYLTPDEAFDSARARGMDYVCFTDHNTIDGALDFLSRRPEEEPRVIVGEEVEIRLPDAGRWIHVGVLGVDERLHDDMKRLRRDAPGLLAHLCARRVPFVLNHPFQSFRSARSAFEQLAPILPAFALVESRNSTSPACHARAVEALLGAAPAAPRGRAGGSDAHTRRRIAAAWTEAPGRTKEEFLRSLRDGECVAAGGAQGLPALVRDVYAVIAAYYRRTWSVPRARGEEGALRNLLGSMLLLPAVVGGLPAILTSLHALRQEWIGRVAVARERRLRGAPARPGAVVHEALPAADPRPRAQAGRPAAATATAPARRGALESRARRAQAVAPDA